MSTRAPKLKVYGWTGHRTKCPPARNGSRQTREIVAAPSMAAVARIAGVPNYRRLFNLCETGNEHEVKTAMARPLVIFWRPLDDYRAQPEYHADA